MFVNSEKVSCKNELALIESIRVLKKEHKAIAHTNEWDIFEVGFF